MHVVLESRAWLFIGQAERAILTQKAVMCGSRDYLSYQPVHFICKIISCVRVEGILVSCSLRWELQTTVQG